MNADRSEISRSSAPGSKLLWSGVVFALLFPTVITWGYFVFAARFPTGVQQATYLVVKAIQFVFPLAWVWFVLCEPPRFRRPRMQGLLLGVVFSVVVVGTGWLLFDQALRDTAVFSRAAAKIHDKLAQLGIDTVWKYALLGVFYCVIHSLLEEYYWRWFVFGQLRRLVPFWPAAVVSALAFMGHHVVVLGEFFHELPWVAWLLSSAVAVGGVFWAWLYERNGSLYGPWLSHLLIDAGIFWVGFELISDSISPGG